MRDYPTAPRGMEALETLICSVEELLRGLPRAADSELGRLRAQAANALAAAKAMVAVSVKPASAETDSAATAHLDGWVRKWPTAAIVGAAMLGVAIGLSASWSVHRRTRRSSA